MIHVNLSLKNVLTTVKVNKVVCELFCYQHIYI